MSHLKQLINKFESKTPEIIFEWHDSSTSAKGWVVINSLRGGACGGGTRLREGVTIEEVKALAKTMEVKFTISGPDIGGAKSGIDFDPEDPRKEEVLERWYQAVIPLLKSYYGTGGDVNVDEARHVVPLTEKHGLWHPQEGIVSGHFKSSAADKIKKIGQLRTGVPSVIANPAYSPDVTRKYTISDLITGYGVAQSVVHYYSLLGGEVKGKTALIHGWGNVGASAGFFLSKAGVKIKGIMDKQRVYLSDEGLSEKEVSTLFNSRDQGRLNHPDTLSVGKGQGIFWNTAVDVFIPCASSRLVTADSAALLLENGCELISCGANVPFDDREILYGALHEKLDHLISIVPDFIANCGMARAYAYLMQEDVEITSDAIFQDVSDTIFKALNEVFISSKINTHISERALEIAINKII